MSNIIDGQKVAEATLQKVALQIAELKQRGVTPGLAVVLVGEDPASKVYVGAKVRKCEQLGMYSRKIALPADTTQQQLIAVIEALNADEQIHGILVQSPPPAHIDEHAVVLAIDPGKDVDGFHPVNVAKLALEDASGFVPCTPAGCIELLRSTGTQLSGANAVVIGRSMIVGKPMALLLMNKQNNATVTVTHSRSKDLAQICAQADIIVAAIGKANFVTADFVKPGAVVIDVGINRVEDASAERGYRLVGDVDFDAVAGRCSYITPVPGGVGPMTIALLMANTVKAALQQNPA